MNSGYLKFDSDMEMEAGVYNTSESRLWTRLKKLFHKELAAEWKKMRDKNYTYENMYDYFVNKQVLNIGEHQYNLNMYAKYIPFYKQYSHMMHGNLVEHFKRWVKERFIYLDSYFGYESDEIKTSITVRVNKAVGAVSPMSITLKTYSPQFVKVRWRNGLGANGEPLYEQIKRVGRNETVTFTMDMPDVTDQEVLIFNAPQLKDIGDLTSLRPSVLLLSNAVKLTSLKCNDSDLLKKVELSSNKMIQDVDLSGCVGLGTDQSGTSLDVTNCSNLKYLDVFGTSLLAVNVNTKGGNIEEIYYPYTVQSIRLVKQTNLTKLGIPYKISSSNTYNYVNNLYCVDLNEVYLEECPYIEKIGENKGKNNGYDNKNMIALSNVRSVTFKNSINSIKYLDFSNCKRLETLNLNDMYNLEELLLNDLQHFLEYDVFFSLKDVNITNCPKLHTIEMSSDQKSDDIKASCVFAKGTTLDLSNCSGLTTVKSNYGIEGLQKIILPNTVKTLVFEGEAARVSDIETIYVKGTHDTDGFIGIDLQGLDLYDFCMESLVKVPRVLNMNLAFHNYPPAINMIRDNINYSYISPEGTVDLNSYKGKSLRGLYKGITGTAEGAFSVIIDDTNELSTVIDCEGMFQDTDLDEETIKNIYNKVFNVENAIRMFKNNPNVSSLSVFYSTINDATEMFYGCSNLRRASFNLSNALESCKMMFMNCRSLIECPSVITDNVVSCEQMFYGCSELVEGPTKLGKAVNTCEMMFSDCYALQKAVETITDNVLSCKMMFQNCYSLEQAPAEIGPRVTTCNRMFYDCGKLPEGPSVIPNNVTNCAEMFFNNKKLVSGPVKIGSSVTSMANMFNGCAIMETVPEAIPDSVTTCLSAFDGCAAISDAPAYLGKSITNMNNTFRNSGIRTCPDIPSTVKHMTYCFEGCFNLLEAPELSTAALAGTSIFKNCTSLVSTPSVIPASFVTIESMFEGCKSLTSTRFSTIPGTISSEKGLNSTFKDCIALTAGPSIIESGVIEAQSAFQGCKSLKVTPTTLGNTLIDASNMFQGCSSLENVAFSILPPTLKNLSYMFASCSNLKMGPSKLSVAAVDCSSMYRDCSSLLYAIDSTDSVLLTTCNNMYYRCSSLTQSTRIPDSVTSVSGMFYGCESMKTLANNGLRATTCGNFLYGCKNLETIREFNLTNYSSLPGNYFGGGSGCDKLKDITFVGTVKFNLDLGFSDYLSSSPTIETLVTALDQRTSTSTLTLILSSTVQDRLSTSQRNTIFQKYWTLALPNS